MFEINLPGKIIKNQLSSIINKLTFTLQSKQTTDSLDHKNKKGSHKHNNHNEQQIKFLPF